MRSVGITLATLALTAVAGVGAQTPDTVARAFIPPAAIRLYDIEVLAAKP